MVGLKDARHRKPPGDMSRRQIRRRDREQLRRQIIEQIQLLQQAGQAILDLARVHRVIRAPLPVNQTSHQQILNNRLKEAFFRQDISDMEDAINQGADMNLRPYPEKVRPLIVACSYGPCCSRGKTADQMLNLFRFWEDAQVMLVRHGVDLDTPYEITRPGRRPIPIQTTARQEILRSLDGLDTEHMKRAFEERGIYRATIELHVDFVRQTLGNSV